MQNTAIVVFFIEKKTMRIFKIDDNYYTAAGLERLLAGREWDIYGDCYEAENATSDIVPFLLGGECPEANEMPNRVIVREHADGNVCQTYTVDLIDVTE